MVLCNICRQDWFESLGKVQGWFATADSWVSLLQSDVWSMWQLTWNINSSEVSLSKYCDRNLASGIQWGALCVWHWGEASYLHPLSVSTTLQVPKNSERTSKCFLACQRHWNGSLRCSFRLGPLKFNICWLTASRTWNEWKHGCLRSSTPTMSEAAPPAVSTSDRLRRSPGDGDLHDASMSMSHAAVRSIQWKGWAGTTCPLHVH